MSGRGRPRTPDILTPREWEVLDLLRSGLSNREIAERLGISLAGAKFHVSEIIGKLGVSSREEAAAWRKTPTRRCGFAPAAVLSGWRVRFAALAASRLALGSAAAAATLGLALAGYGATRLASGGAAGLPATTGSASSRVADACKALYTVQCMNRLGENIASLDAAADIASFEPRLPRYIPDGFEPIFVRHSRPNWWDPEDVRRNCPGCDPQMSHNDQIGAYYRDAAGHWLAITQGFPGEVPWHSMSPDLLPDGRQGMVAIGGGLEASWSRSGPTLSPTVDAQGNAVTPQWDDKQLTLYWTAGRIGDGWEISPDRTTISYGSPFSYSITSDVLPLAELVSIAESILAD